MAAGAEVKRRWGAPSIEMEAEGMRVWVYLIVHPSGSAWSVNASIREAAPREAAPPPACAGERIPGVRQARIRRGTTRRIISSRTGCAAPRHGG